MHDSGQEPPYSLSKNLLLLPRILKLMKDMVDDSTPLRRKTEKQTDIQTYRHTGIQAYIQTERQNDTHR